MKRTIEAMAATPTCHLEVTTLIIPGKNDSPEEIAAAARWLASLDNGIVYHITRFFPCHRCQDRPGHSRAHRVRPGRTWLANTSHVYTGNC